MDKIIQSKNLTLIISLFSITVFINAPPTITIHQTVDINGTFRKVINIPNETPIKNGTITLLSQKFLSIIYFPRWIFDDIK